MSVADIDRASPPTAADCASRLINAGCVRCWVGEVAAEWVAGM